MKNIPKRIRYQGKIYEAVGRAFVYDDFQDLLGKYISDAIAEYEKAAGESLTDEDIEVNLKAFVGRRYDKDYWKR